MKTIGLVGGTSWTSTLEYYRSLNEDVAARRGGLHSARLVLVSLNFAELEEAMHANRWHDASRLLRGAAGQLQAAGADFVLLCSNLIHKMAEEVQQAVSIPLLHIGDAIGDEIRRNGFRTVGLLGARPTMEEEFYARRIRERSGADVIIPPDEARIRLDEAIFGRMCRNVYEEGDRHAVQEMIDDMKARGAEAVILGCTELPVLVATASLPLLNSFQLHSHAAVDRALGP